MSAAKTDTIVVHSEAVEEAAQKSEKIFLAEHLEDGKKILAEVLGDAGNGVEPFVIESDSDFEFVGEMLLHAKKNKRSLEDRRSSVTGPLYKVIHIIEGWFREPITQWGKLEKHLKGLIRDYELKKAEEEAKAIEEITKASNEGDYDRAHEASLVIHTERPKVAGVSTREVWVPDMDKVDLDLVPTEFLIRELNMKVVEAYVRQFDKGRPDDLPGLPFKKDIAISGSKRG